MSRLDEIKDRVEKATEGPWCYEICGDTVMVGVVYGADNKPLEDEVIDMDDDGNEIELVRDGIAEMHQTGRDVVDATFIAHSRDDIPWLVAEVERLEHEIEGWRNKWECAVDMAARAENEVERLRAALAEEMEISRARKAVADALEEK